jgi:UDP-glucose 4-epimerase
MKILLTGGLGFIGSHCSVVLNQEGHETIIIDNFENAKYNVLSKIKQLCTFPRNVSFYQGDVSDHSFLTNIFEKECPEVVIHLASLKSVNQSIDNPLLYYKKNLTGLLNVLQVMQEQNCHRIIFSSSSTVYGNNNTSPLDETMVTGLNITNPYGQTKYMQECILQDYAKANPKMNIILLRYFNPVGAHPSGLIGENPNGIPNNLFPYILKVANKEYPELKIFGKDYNTEDGTCVRDFIHVMDLAHGHVASFKQTEPGCHIYNLGTGKGTSVWELVKTFETTNSVNIPYVFEDRRKGDIESVYCDVSKAKEELDWETKRTIEDICKDGYAFARTQI